ncbi:hypothetical protein [Changchengzhania lutea]|uniref:hypothetical protein n=1 Tax=Changchengzhania lutea TaxID=2049305 RepID=UPI00115E1607|nr:hypothetical protein [Changchengzhania lutea]
MKRIVFLFIISTLWSCDYFNVKKTSADAILEEELKTFNWNEVDVYPSFSECDSLTSNIDRKDCFQQILTQGISNYLQQEHIVVTEDINDTIYLKFHISETGDLSILKSQMDSLTRQEIPNIENLLLKSLDELPKAFPAVKRGQQVKTEFQLPLVISVQ